MRPGMQDVRAAGRGGLNHVLASPGINPVDHVMIASTVWIFVIWNSNGAVVRPGETLVSFSFLSVLLLLLSPDT